MLGMFKYYDFILENIMNLLGFHFFNISAEQVPYMNFVLPLGISFFTFQGISYLIDIYRGDLSHKNSILDVMLFISFFPHLMAGPIVKANEFIPQLKNRVDPSKIPIYYSLFMILLGLFKKIVIASYLGTDIVDPIFENPSLYSSSDILFGVYSYAIQIYCDFSAYSDLAIAFAGLLGYEFPINFDQPYRATSLQDFWRRWHISLSTWLRDYLYKPLGGSKLGNIKTYRNVFITMLLGGLWHGASWNFIFWGFLHGLGLIFEKYFQFNTKINRGFIIKSLKTILVFHFVCFAWIFFRSPTLDKVMELFGGLFKFDMEAKKISFFYALLLTTGIAFHFVKPLKLWSFPEIIFKKPRLVFALAVSIVITIISTLSPEGVAPFIYFRF